MERTMPISFGIAVVLCVQLRFSCASYTEITGYLPASDVTQHSYIDKDQNDFEVYLGLGTTDGYTAAANIYNNGANSGGYAEFTIPESHNDFTSGTGYTVVQPSTSAEGYVKSDSANGSTTLKVSYTTTCSVDRGSGITLTDDDGTVYSGDTTGCFSSTDEIEVTHSEGTETITPTACSESDGYCATYRTLAGFSTAAESKMLGQVVYQKYKAYYSDGAYADAFVQEALSSGTDPDSSSYFWTKDDNFRVEVAKKTSAYMNVWMYAIREMEDAIDDCTANCIDCNDDPVHAWDEFVAFYSGSLEGADGDSAGKLLYRLADKRCANYGTCASGTIGTSNVNSNIMEYADTGRDNLQMSKCIETISVKDYIVEQMSIPLVQGTLRYAYKVAYLSGGDKEIAEGLVFARAILPRVAACDSDDAAVIYKYMANFSNSYDCTSGSSDVSDYSGYSSCQAVDFEAVKTAFENNYDCLGISCSDVGGLVKDSDDDGSVNEYYDNFSPCSDGDDDDDDDDDDSPRVPIWAIIIIVLAILMSCVLGGGICYMKRDNSQLKQRIMKYEKVDGSSELQMTTSS